MSFDFTNIKKKDELNPIATPNVVHPQDDAALYNARKAGLVERISNISSSSDLPLVVRVGFLTSEDKNALIAELTTMGYTCSVNGNSMSIQ